MATKKTNEDERSLMPDVVELLKVIALRSEETREGVIGTYTFYGTQLVAATWKPYRIYDYGQPVFMNTKDSATALQTMEAASDQLATRLKEPTTSPIPAMPPAPAYAPQSAPK